MKVLFTSDPGIAGKRYTVVVDTVVVGSFDSHDEVLNELQRHPDGACTIKFGSGLSWTDIEANELAKKIENMTA